MYQQLSEFINKSVILFRYFVKLYSKPLFVLDRIDQNEHIIYYKNQRSEEIFSMKIKAVINNRLFLSRFSSKDAAYIGYLYGMWIQSKNQ